MFGFLLCVPADLPGTLDRPLRPPGWSVQGSDRGQMTQFVFMSKTQQGDLALN